MRVTPAVRVTGSLKASVPPWALRFAPSSVVPPALVVSELIGVVPPITPFRSVVPVLFSTRA